MHRKDALASEFEKKTTKSRLFKVGFPVVIMDHLPEKVYHPTFEETQLVRFTRFVEEKYDMTIKDFWDLHKWSCKNYPEFWDSVWQFFDVQFTKPYIEVYDTKNGFANMEWFRGVRFNYAANILKYRDSHTAIIATDKDDNAEYITYEQLYEEVHVYVEALKESGVTKGDTVICFMGNKKEAIFAFLATVSIGAIWSGALPLLGSKGAISRFEQINPKILFTAGNFLFEGTEIDMLNKIPSIVFGLPSLSKVVFIPSKQKSLAEDISHIPKCVLITDFLKNARETLDKGSVIELEQVHFDYPLCISFTSGTTGAPKGLVHSHGSFFSQLKDLGLHHNVTRKDVLFNFSPVGWISWNMYVNSLHLGITLCSYDGYPFDETPMRYWDLVDKYGLTCFFIWSSTVEDLEKNNLYPTENHSLESLRIISPNGSPAKPKCFTFLSHVKPNLFCCPGYGTTEFFGLISGMDTNLPLYKGEIQTISLGLDVVILDENEEPVEGKTGELVVSTPYPGLFVSLLNDDNKEMFTELYLSQHPGYFNVGDIAWINPVTKGLVVYGRSDETMNPKGARFNCSEIYFALEDFPGLADSVVVSQYNSDLDERVVLFVKMLSGHSLTPEVKHDIKMRIENTLTVEHVPEIIMEAPDIPYNLTGKKLNSLVKKLINKRPVKNTDVVVNPASVEFFRTIDLGEF